MTELAEDTQAAMCYPKEVQYKQWKDWAEKMDYASVSRFMIEMIEAGYKQLDLSVDYDQSTRELRNQRNDLKHQLDASRDRVEQLEGQLYRGERQSILDFLDDREHGATFADIVQHTIDDAPARVAYQIEEMDGEEITQVDGRYTQATSTDEESESRVEV